MPGSPDWTDSQLLKAFAEVGDEEAFAELVRRHGPLILNVCHRVLGNASDAEDAAQAAFLALARQAPRWSTYRPAAPWLHRVAHNIALNVLGSRKARERREKEVAAMTRRADRPAGLSDEEGALLHEEINALPDKYRQALILCHLQGKSLEQAATVMARPKATIGTWVARGREQLKDRLARRGLVLSLAVLTSLLSAEAGAAELPATFVVSTTTAAKLFVATASGAGIGAEALSSRISSLAEGALKQMSYARLQFAMLIMLLLLSIGAGTGWLVNQATGSEAGNGAVATSVGDQRLATGNKTANDKSKAKPMTAAEATKMTTTANTDFALDLYGQLSAAQKDRDLFFSPYSITNALAMCAEGARGETAEEMGKVLRFPDALRRAGDEARLLPWRMNTIHNGLQGIKQKIFRDPDDPKAVALRQEVEALRKQLGDAKKATAADYSLGKIEVERRIVKRLNELLPQVDPFELNVANALWAEKSYPIEASFRKTIARHYDTGAVRAADFKADPEGERVHINGWVEEQTRKYIRNLIPRGSVDSLTRLILVNAIYFKGEWDRPFNENATEELDFIRFDGSKTRLPIMQANWFNGGRYGAFEGDGTYFKTPHKIAVKDNKIRTYPGKEGFAMAELPYKGKELSMLLIAPLAHDGLAAIEKQITSAHLMAWLARLEKRTMHVKLPKFKLETSYPLHKQLSKMGMVRAFTDPREPGGADFTGIHNTEDLAERLCITAVLHKAYLDVNEKGTEAAAATAVPMASKEPVALVPQLVPFIPTFSADRPFLLMIRHNATGTILFMGRVTDPSGEKANAF